MGILKNEKIASIICNKQKLFIKILLHTIVPLLLGMSIYISWRSIYFIDASGYYYPMFSSLHIPNWIKFNLSDGLWFYALLSAIFIIWKENFSGNFIKWLIFAIIVSYLSEFFQAYGIFPGTFDWKDLLSCSIALVLFLIINKRALKN